MKKEIVTCAECEFFSVHGDGMTICKNIEAIPFPMPTDYCSKGKRREGTKTIINDEELLKLVYSQRR